MYEKFMSAAESISSVVWGTPTIILLVSAGLFFSVSSGFFQFTHITLWLKCTLGKLLKEKTVKEKDENTISPFQAITTALASTIGTGNIAGVATAISLGGPGAVFWMWISAVFGMMTSFSENTLGIYYRKKDENGSFQGGPMQYIKAGLSKNEKLKGFGKLLSVLYAVFLLGATFGIGNMTQANSVSDSLSTCFKIPTAFTGLILSAITFVVISGGVKRIGNLTEKLVPFMALFYIITTLIVFLSNFKSFGYVFSSIFKSAFSLTSVTGAVSGQAIKNCISTGFKRGVFSNEAGLGASVTVNSCSSTKEPCEQGMWGIFGVFVDTLIVCTMTAFVLLSTTVEAYNIEYALKNSSAEIQYVYIGNENFQKSKRVYITDTKANKTYKIKNIPNTNGYFETERTDKYTYTNIMRLHRQYDKNGRLTYISLQEADGVSLVSIAFKERFGTFASALLSISIVLFSFSTIIGWSFYGTKATEYLFGKGSTKAYKLIYTALTFCGSVLKLSVVWAVSDIMNGLMAIPNLIGILALSKKANEIRENYLLRKKGIKVKPMLSAFEDGELDT